MKEKEQFVGFDRFEYKPIIRQRSELLLKELVQTHQPKRILEIGTFIGYSAACMLEAFEGAHITTLEKDEKNFLDAKENLKVYGKRANLVHCDAFDFLRENVDKTFDLVFLDGPKGQYMKYLPFLKQMLPVGGVLICDDILLHGLVKGEEKVAHKHRSMVNNLRKFLDDLAADANFETTFYDFEDGISISIKR